ncbi:hypothetical protein DSM104299_03873 [Baekduia alba]|uniref:alpha/beta hydrolase n=1 Tax=Baekduia alba TaxID=2997333 RepID=UPI00234085D1|nr:alpha/beta hydrolase family protein [Baekduia alba]WCB95131.1 hypothetical protein DSM104299_03873 [Baekduia alba]
MSRRAAVVAGACALLAVTLLGAHGAPGARAAGGPAPCVARATPVRLGLDLVRRATDGRLVTLTLASRAMGGRQRVAVLLPRGYPAGGRRRYPVLYLLHGTGGSYAGWSAQGDVARIVGDRRLIVVMPDDSANGAYTDWYGLPTGVHAPVPAWESYHLSELLPWIDRHYRTVAARGGRIVAGLSSGGAGAMKYAARHPGLFGWAGSFSGAVDLGLPAYRAVAPALNAATPPGGLPGTCTFGPPGADAAGVAANDATALAPNLKGTGLFVASGSGVPGPLDAPGPITDVQAGVERVVWPMNQAFATALDAAGVARTTDFYGSGTHAWPYWQRELGRFLTWLDPRVGHPQPAPRAFSVRSGEAAFAAWGWDFAVRRGVRELLYLSDVRRAGLTAQGSGTVTVTSPPLYRPGRRYRVGAATRPRHVAVADADGRLRFGVDLGPAHRHPQTTFTPEARRTWRRAVIHIDEAR